MSPLALGTVDFHSSRTKVDLRCASNGLGRPNKRYLKRMNATMAPTGFENRDRSVDDKGVA